MPTKPRRKESEAPKRKPRRRVVERDEGGEISDGSDDEGRRLHLCFEELRQRCQARPQSSTLRRLDPRAGLPLLLLPQYCPHFHPRTPRTAEPLCCAELEKPPRCDEGLLVYCPQKPDEVVPSEGLVFEAQFESGNLQSARRRGPDADTYDLKLLPDTSTRSHALWYFFAVSNTRKGQTYTFNITNLTKVSSVYSDGMHPCVYSTRAAEESELGWVRDATASVGYFPNGMKRVVEGKKGQYYTLTFQYTAVADGDKVFFAHCYPYTYTDLQRDLERLESPHCVRTDLCSTVAGNRCELVTITAPPDEGVPYAERPGIVLTARVHPGESNASWVMKGALELLCADLPIARRLREQFVFKVVPMLNPDGVVVGNYRCSLMGVDLNRCWATPSRDFHPTIYHTKQMMLELAQERPILSFVDIHGHSRKMNCFLYGSSSDQPCVREQLLPRLLALEPPFSLEGGGYKVQKCKEGTARVVVYRELGVTFAYTLEASFCGPDYGPRARTHFSQRELEGLGKRLAEMLLELLPGSKLAAEVLRQCELSEELEEEQDPPEEPEDPLDGSLRSAPCDHDDHSVLPSRELSRRSSSSSRVERWDSARDELAARLDQLEHDRGPRAPPLVRRNGASRARPPGPACTREPLACARVDLRAHRARELRPLDLQVPPVGTLRSPGSRTHAAQRAAGLDGLRALSSPLFPGAPAGQRRRSPKAVRKRKKRAALRERSRSSSLPGTSGALPLL